MNWGSPAEIDIALRNHTLSKEVVCNQVDAGILRARVALHFQRRLDMLSALNELQSCSSLQAQGLSIALCAQLNLFADALALPFNESAVITPEDEDGAYWAHMGRSGVYMDSDCPALAMEELGMARVYAIRLRAEGREEYVRAERQRLAGHAGLSNPEETLALLRTMTPNTNRYRWHQQTYLTDRLACGEYETVTHEDFRYTSAYGLACAFLGRGTPNDLVDAVGPLATVGRMVWKLREGYPVGMPLTGSGMVHTYSRVICGMSLAMQRRTAVHAPAILGSTIPARLDQRFLWATATLLAFVHGAEIDDPLQLPTLINETLDALKDTRCVLQLIIDVAPEVLLLLSIGPKAHDLITTAAISVPLLKDARVTAPGWSGASHSRPANVAVVIRGIDRMVTAASDAQRVALERQWAQARHTVGYLLDDHQASSTENVHCLAATGGVTVKA